jgi:hypothetical protein
MSAVTVSAQLVRLDIRAEGQCRATLEQGAGRSDIVVDMTIEQGRELGPRIGEPFAITLEPRSSDATPPDPSSAEPSENWLDSRGDHPSPELLRRLNDALYVYHRGADRGELRAICAELFDCGFACECNGPVRKDEP